MSAYGLIAFLVMCSTIVIIIAFKQHERDMEREFIIEQMQLIIEMKKVGIDTNGSEEIQAD